MRMVMKFGGSSLSDTERIRMAALRIAREREQGHQVVAVVSAQGDTTDELIEKGRSLSDPEARKEVYSELNQIIYENCTQLFICHPLTVEACTKYVEGFVSNKDGYNRLWTVKCLQS